MFLFQGMSDFLAPILFVMEDESESFWCFASLMERLGANFNRDQNGMHAQLLALSKVYNIFMKKVQITPSKFSLCPDNLIN